LIASHRPEHSSNRARGPDGAVRRPRGREYTNAKQVLASPTRLRPLGYGMPLPYPESMTAPGSVTRLLPGLKGGERDAVRAVWERYFQPLVRVVADRMNPARCRAIGPEDLAQEVLLELCALLATSGADDRFPRLTNREN